MRLQQPSTAAPMGDPPRTDPGAMPALEWRIDDAPVAYPDAVAAMEDRARRIRDEGAPELVWLLEHPPLYTAGTSARPEDLLWADRFPVFKTGRGGEYTYHGPGQRVAYVLLDLKARAAARGGEPDLRRFVQDLEAWAIAALDRFGVTGERRDGRVGIWVDRNRHPGRGGALPGQEDKIAAIGVRVRRWVTFHGISLNVDPDLTHFQGIVPCGIRAHGVTSLVDLGLPVTMSDADMALAAAWEDVFGPSPPADGSRRDAKG